MPPSFNLTDDQRRAVETTSPIAVIYGGPGTGKTTLLPHRLKVLLDRGTPAGRICVLTSTTAAAAPILAQYPQIWSGTVHRLATEIVRSLATVASRTTLLSVWDDLDVLEVARDIARKLHLAEDSSKAILAQNDAKREFAQRLRDSNALTLDQVLPSAREILRNYRTDPRLARYQFEAVVVDDAQDSDEETLGLLHDLGVSSRWFLADPRQTLFAWLGARPDLLPQEGEVVLDKNFRQRENVLDLVNRAKPVDGPPLAACREPGGFVYHHRSAFEPQLVPDIIREIASCTPLDDIAILARTWAQLAAVRVKLNLEGIRTRFYGDLHDPWSSGGGRTLLRWLLLCSNTSDNELAAMIARDIFGDAPELKICRASAFMENRTLRHVLTQGGYLPPVGPRTLPTGSHADVLRSFILKHNPQLWTARAEWCLEQLQDPERSSLGVFRAWATHGRSAADRIAWARSLKRPPGVHLLTVDAARGLEFPAVVLVGASRENFARDEDDRRALYVALSRARDELHLIRSDKQTALEIADERADGDERDDDRDLERAELPEPRSGQG